MRGRPLVGSTWESVFDDKARRLASTRESVFDDFARWLARCARRAAVQQRCIMLLAVNAIRTLLKVVYGP
jgi:hypothetical protein